MPVAARVLVVGLLAVVVWLTNDPFFLVGSSGSISQVLAPAVGVQIGCVTLALAAALVPGRGVWRTGRGVLMAVALLLAGHRLVVDVFKAEARDVYLGVAVQTFRFDPDAASLDVNRSFARVDVSQGGPGGMWVFSPPWVGLNVEAGAGRAARGESVGLLTGAIR